MWHGACFILHDGKRMSGNLHEIEGSISRGKGACSLATEALFSFWERSAGSLRTSSGNHSAPAR